jgi:hypothetical protein
VGEIVGSGVTVDVGSAVAVGSGVAVGKGVVVGTGATGAQAPTVNIAKALINKKFFIVSHKMLLALRRFIISIKW